MQTINTQAFRQKHFFTFVALCLLCLALFSTSSHALPKVTFACGINPHLPVYKELESRYRQAFANMGYDFTMVPTNVQRAFVNANNGMTDGECARIYSFNDTHPNSHLIRVDVLVGNTELGVWSYTDKINIDNVDAIKNGNFKVGFPRGLVMSENFVADNKITNTVVASDFTIAIKMLSAQRFDLLIASSDLIRQELPSLELRAPIYKVGVLTRLKAYPFIHDSKRDLIPRFTTELQKLVPPEGVSLE